ncbi:MAG: chromate efflux transporter [Rhodospirillaceae bacterium]|nr:chromate efflux transporter [Rhodospirillaceae bacterium]MBT6403204.1 chromate efflux transporter [Rhodospirillaceae bacterium]MBT6536360.1 chromate efflux transporter [Rhodospirillaceae bacterium]MBT7362376.1 chromate efflux transporter [Rhodospirillaceae bacterium]
MGATAFGGPVAHFGYFRTEFVDRRRWIDERGFADLVSLCQFLPGPASSQTGIAIGMIQRGWLGGVAAWLGFTTPAAIIMIGLGFGLSFAETAAGQGIVHGLKLAAVAVVANALWGMARNACGDAVRASFAAIACVAILFAGGAWFQLLVIAAAAIAGSLILRDSPLDTSDGTSRSGNRAVGLLILAVFLLLLLGLPVLAETVKSGNLDAFSGFYRVGALVFGGGHVVLPLLEAEVVPTGWTTTDAFLAGYGAAQAIPGPMFALTGYLGNVIDPGNGYLGGWTGGVLAIVAVFLPSFLLLGATLPYWDALRSRARIRSALSGVNAAVVGLLLAVLFTPVWTSSVRDSSDFATVVVAVVLLALWRLPPWLVVMLAAVAGFFGI